MYRDFHIPGIETHNSPFVADELIEHQTKPMPAVTKAKPAATSIPPPETIVQELAVLPFSAFDQKAFYGDFMAYKENALATDSNKKRFSKFGIPYADFLAQLEKYVDLNLIETALKKKFPAETFKRNPTEFDNIVTEGVHQLQFKCSNSDVKTYFDGIPGSHTLDNLGFVFHSKRYPIYTPVKTIETAFKKITKDIETYAKSTGIKLLENVTGSNWFSYRCNPVIFGRKGKNGNGFSVFLVLELRKAEAQLFTLYDKQLSSLFATKILSVNELNDEINALIKTPSPGTLIGNVPSLLGNALEIDEDHGDIRNPDSPTSTSMHLTGLAIDIRYKLNPWVRDKAGLNLLIKAADYGTKNPSSKPLLKTDPVYDKILKSYYTTKHPAQSYFEYLGKTYTTGEIYDLLAPLSKAFIKYYESISKEKEIVTWGEPHGDEPSKRRASVGFLNLNKDLVVILRDKICLAWGPVDFGVAPKGNGDMMHFDMRTSSIGRGYRIEIKNPVEDYLKMVHPCFQLPNQVPANAKDSWYVNLFQKLYPFPFWAIKGTRIMVHLISLYQKGEKDPVNLTNRLFYDVLYPERNGAPIKAGEDPVYKKHWNALFNFVVGPFLLLSGRAIKSLQGNLIVPSFAGTPTLLVKNEFGMVQFPLSGPGFGRYTSGNIDDSYRHPITGKTGKYGDNWIDPQTAADFYNAIQDFRAIPHGQNVIIHYGDISAYNPAINIGHHTHNQGRAIDIHYLGSAGEEFSLDKLAYRKGDISKMNTFFSIVEKYGFLKNYTYGKRFKHTGDNNESDHNDHFHIGQAKIIVPVTKEFNEHTDVPIEQHLPASGATHAVGSSPVIKRIPDPFLFIRPTKFVWRGKTFRMREIGLQKYAVNVGCLPKNVSIFYDFAGQVLIRSGRTGEEMPYNVENHKLNFPGTYFYSRVEILPGRDTNLTFSTRLPGKINREGKFESRGNTLQLEKFMQTITFWFIVSDPGNRYSTHKDSASSLMLEIISTDIPGLCEEAQKAEDALTYYSNWYTKEAEKWEPLKTKDWENAIRFERKDLEKINYYLTAVGLRLDDKGFLKLLPSWQAPDYWRWKSRNSIWNERQILYINSSIISDKLLNYKNNYFVDKGKKTLPFNVFIGELRRFENLNAGDIAIEEQILRLRRCGHELSLPFDQVLKTPPPGELKDWEMYTTMQYYSNKGLGGNFQFMKDHNLVYVNGAEIDFWHLFVGMDALFRDKGRQDKVTVSNHIPHLPQSWLYIDETELERAAASTWAGDIGSVLADWRIRFDEANEKSKHLETREARLDYYWTSRASFADLDGDILAWGLYDMRGSMKSVRLSDLLLYFFHPAQFKQNRKKAFELFVKHYSLPGQSKKLDIPRLEQQIEGFSNIWGKFRLLKTGKLIAYNDKDLRWGLSEVVSRFINYVDKQLV